MRKSKKVSVDPDKVKTWLKDKGLSAAQVSTASGKSEKYLSNCLQNREIPLTQVKLLEALYGLKLEDVAPAAPSEGDSKNEAGYQVAVNVYPKAVKFSILFEGKQIQCAWSRIKDRSELSLFQAISYAAHMCYKLQEQKAIEAEDKK